MFFRHSFEKRFHCRLHHTCMINKAVRLIIIAAVFVMAGLAPNVQAEDVGSYEYVLKAAFLYNLAKFVELPAEAFADDQGVIEFCILGKDPFGSALESVKGKTVKGRKVMIKRTAKISDVQGCHVLFISRSEKKHLSKVFAELEDSNVLTVGDMRDFVQKGGMINFITAGQKIRFEVNVSAAERNGLKISSKLLKLATSVSK